MDTHRVSRTEARSHARHPMASSSSPFASPAHFSAPKLLNFSRHVRQRTSLFRLGEEREQLGKFVFADPILSGAGKMKG